MSPDNPTGTRRNRPKHLNQPPLPRPLYSPSREEQGITPPEILAEVVEAVTIVSREEEVRPTRTLFKVISALHAIVRDLIGASKKVKSGQMRWDQFVTVSLL